MIPIQGSDTFGIESVLSSVQSPLNKPIHGSECYLQQQKTDRQRNQIRFGVFSNGVYGDRMYDLAQKHYQNPVIFRQNDNQKIDSDFIANNLSLHSDLGLNHIGLVHSETSSGVMNDLNMMINSVKKTYNI